MCLSVPGEVLSINGDRAEVSVGGTRYHAGIQLVDDIKVGDYILIHSGFAIQKISKKDADETMAIFAEIGEKLRETTPAKQKRFEQK
ncbi:HypC/HybG/HupF family hydrogenase formation chaperone [Candidatus Margulisiibacteriota bacterium]